MTSAQEANEKGTDLVGFYFIGLFDYEDKTAGVRVPLELF